MDKLFADIIIANTNVDRPFTYIIPEGLRDDIIPGCPVLIEFGKSIKKGYVLEVRDSTGVDTDRLKPIISIPETELNTEEALLSLAIWIKHRYGVTFDKAIRAVMPVKSTVEEKTNNEIILNIDTENMDKLVKELVKKRRTAWIRLLEALKTSNPLPQSYVNQELKINSATIKGMEGEGIISITKTKKHVNPLLPILRSLGTDELENVKSGEDYILNEEQRAAVDIFKTDFEQDKRHTYLLHGVTGSGKTLVFINMIRYAISKGYQAIVLIPEISLTYQTVLRMTEYFGERVAIINSKLSKTEKYCQFDRIKTGEADVIIGPRSAIFAPVRRLGLIVIDEEHDSAYKNDNVPGFNIRDVAKQLAKICNSPLILSSATPSPESYKMAMEGDIKLLRLTKRAKSSSLPRVTVVDMREELKRGNRSIFSTKLREMIEDRLKKGRQIMLFMNRRGYSSFVSCRSCGEVIKCKHCDVSMTLHNNNRLICHYCGYSIPMPDKCPNCSSKYIANFGTGTQKLEEITRSEFPGARVIRMDTDSVRGKNSVQDMVRQFAAGDADILIGTQMIVKGHDFSNVTLVGIMAADTSLYVSSYNSAQRTFELLTQAVGRTGRAGEGDAVIQTYTPENYAIAAASRQDYEKYYKNEMSYRIVGNYPPACFMMTVMFSGKKEEELNKCADNIGVIIKETKAFVNTVVIGPTAPAVYRVKDYYRKLLYIKNVNYDILLEIQKIIDKNTGFYKSVGAVYDFN